VLAVLVCHDGDLWLPDALAALHGVSPPPRYVLAVDTGSTDDTPALLAAALTDGLVDGVLTMPAGTGFGDAVRHAVERAEQRWGDPGRWLWLLHDDSAPDPSSLAALLGAAAAAPSAAVLGPLCLDWSDPRLVIEAGLSTDASGHRQTGLGAAELNPSLDPSLDPSLLGGGHLRNTEVLAVGSAGALVRRDAWHELGGYDRALPLFGDDVDFGWRVNRAGHRVLVVPSARIRHAAAGSRGERATDALSGVPPRAAHRAHGVRTFLANCSTVSYLLGLPRLVVLCLLRALAFALVRRGAAARAELHAVGYLVRGQAGLRAARRCRRAGAAARGGGVRGLLVGRWNRLRSAVRDGLLALVRRRMAADVAHGRLPSDSAGRLAAVSAGLTTAQPAGSPAVLAVGPDALPAGALGRRGLAGTVAGLRRPGMSVVVPAALPLGYDVTAQARTHEPGGPDPGRTAAGAAAPPPSPAQRQSAPCQSAPHPPPADLIVVHVGATRLMRELLLAPPVLLVAGLVLVAAVVHRGRYGLDLSGGRLAPVAGLAQTWSAYLAEWHPVFGGTAAPAPATLAVFGVLGALVRPFGGGPAAAVSLLLLGAIPLAGLCGYLATRRLPVPRGWRALAAAVYALLPVGTSAAVEGRMDGVVAHILLPPVLAGVAGALSGRSIGGGTRGWLPSACATALALAVISAFTPLVHLLVLALVLVGFVAVPGPRGRGLRRVVALFVVVLLPLGLLLPWPAVVVQHPSVLLHGAGMIVAEHPSSPLRLFMLDAAGTGAAASLGGLVVAVSLGAVALRPGRAAVPGLAVAALGMIAALMVGTLEAVPLPGGAARPGWPGSALLLSACGLLWAALAALSIRSAPGRRPRPAFGDDVTSSQSYWGNVTSSQWRAAALGRRAAQAGAGVVITALAGATVLIGAGGALGTTRPRLADAIQAEVSADRTGVLVVGAAGEPVRGAVGRLPAAGDDDLAPVATAPARMARWAAALRSGQQTTAQAAVLEAAVAGFEFAVLPDRASAAALLGAAGPVTAAASDTSDGRPTVRLLPQPYPAPPNPVVVLAPQVADRARTGGAPPADYGRQGVVGVPAAPPTVGLGTEAGPRGRLMVVAAEMEDGWLATVNGRRTQVGRAWGHLVAVPVPAEAADVRLERSSAVRVLLLLVQLALALFTAVTAVPPAEQSET
jgi:GT2 family glycosyltransferase